MVIRVSATPVDCKTPRGLRPDSVRDVAVRPPEALHPRRRSPRVYRTTRVSQLRGKYTYNHIDGYVRGGPEPRPTGTTRVVAPTRP